MTFTEKQIRATFEDTKTKQRLFRHKLTELINENRPVNDDERDKVIDLYNDANLGLGGVETVLWLNTGKKIVIPNLEKFVRDLIDYNEQIVNGEFFFFSLGHYKELSVPIKELWRQIKSKTNQVNAEALTQTLRMSKEIVDIYSGKTSSFDYDDI
jgi:hypothetical protein